jgi:hypothetical protein
MQPPPDAQADMVIENPEAGDEADADDEVIVPAPDASVFYHRPDYATPRPAGASFGQSLKFRQTFIPVLLTGGLILIALGAMHFAMSGQDNPIAGMAVWLAALLLVFGLGLWGLAGANMMVVKHIIESQRKTRR